MQLQYNQSLKSVERQVQKNMQHRQNASPLALLFNFLILDILIKYQAIYISSKNADLVNAQTSAGQGLLRMIDWNS